MDIMVLYQLKRIGQIFKVDVTLKVNLEEAGQSDNVIDTVHYGSV